MGLDQPERVEALSTSSSLFHLLGAQPLYGRLLLPEEDTPGKPAVVILSYNFWRRLFNSDPNIVGRSITLNGIAAGSGTDKNQFTVVGVLRPEFLLNEEVMPTVASIRQMDVFLPLPFGADAVNRRGDENYNLMARLKPGVTVEQAQADISVIAANIREKDKRDRTFTISVVPLLDQVVGDVRRAVLVLLGSVALVLLIACANVANLLLTRASGRQKEVAIRTALGASWKRLVRQLLTESVLLGLMGGAVGLLIAKGEPVRRSHDQSGQHSAPGRHRHRRRRAGIHLRRVDPDGDRLRPRSGVARRQGRPQHLAQDSAAAARREMAASAPRGAACGACSWSPRSRSRSCS